MDLIPTKVLVPVAVKFTKQTKRCADTWTTSDVELRSSLPVKYHAVPVDWIKNTCQNLRKSGKYDMNVGGAGPRKYEKVESELNSEYEEWITSKEFKDGPALEAKKRAEWRCQFCNQPHRKGNPLHAHHRSYDRMKTKDEVNDLVALCRKCHFAHHDFVRSLPNEDTLF